MDERVLASLLRGDVLAALAFLDGLTATESTEALRALRARLHDRFFSVRASSESLEAPLVDRVRSAYQAYWRNAMTSHADIPSAESALLHTLCQLAGIQFRSDFDAVEQALESALAREEIETLFGVVSPLRSFLAWRESREASFAVETLGGPVTFAVTLLDSL